MSSSIWPHWRQRILGSISVHHVLELSPSLYTGQIGCQLSSQLPNEESNELETQHGEGVTAGGCLVGLRQHLCVCGWVSGGPVPSNANPTLRSEGKRVRTNGVRMMAIVEQLTAQRGRLVKARGHGQH
jgi:hypothetical protein